MNKHVKKATLINSPFISVVLANYNGERYLSECLDSVLSQSYERYEFIVVDDASTDGSIDLIDEYVRKSNGRMRLIKQSSNAGQAEGFNVGIQASKGALVSFIDSDDIWFRDKLSTVAADFGDPSLVAFHQHNLYFLRGSVLTDTSYRATLSIGDVLGEAVRTRRPPIFVPTAGLTFSRRVLQRIGPIPSAFRTCADGYLTRTAMCFGRVSGSDACCGAYRVHGTNHTFNNPSFDNGQYMRELLLPRLNAFYQLNSIPLAFPIPAEPNPRLVPTPATALRLRDGERVLVVRSAPVERVARVLSSLFAANANISVDLLVQPGFETVFQDPRVTDLAMAAGPMTADSLSRGVRKLIGSREYAFIVVPYNDPDGRKYGNVHRVLRGLPATCPIVGFGSTGAVYSVSESDLADASEAGESLFSPIPTWAWLRDRHKGKRAFIIGDAASLPVSDLDRLKEEITFSADDVYRLFPLTRWRPTYYTVSDRAFAVQHAEATRTLQMLMFLPSELRGLNCAGPRTLWFTEYADNRFVEELTPEILDTAEMLFSEDAGRGIQSGYAVVYRQLQIAFYMGIRDIVLFGVNLEGKSGGNGGNASTAGVSAFQACALRSAKKAYARVGGSIVEVSDKSTLTMFPQVGFDSVVPVVDEG